MNKLLNTSGGVIILIVAVVSLNIIFSKVNFRADVTDENIYTLSEGTKSLLGDLKDPLQVKLYFSRSQKELPIVFKDYATRVEEVLNEYAVKSGGKISIEIIDPKPDTDEEEWARKYGINGARLPGGDQLYFGVVFINGRKELAIPYLDPRREEFLEYDLSEAIVSIFRESKPKIGILAGIDVMGGPNPHMPGGPGANPWAFVSTLQKNFEVSGIDANATTIDAAISTVIVMHPKDLGPGTLYALDQYLVGGGRLVVAVDPMSRTDLASNQMARQMGQVPKVGSDLNRLFTAWDLEFTSDLIVGDVKQSTRIGAGGIPVEYPYFITLNEQNFAKTSVVTSSLKNILYAEGGSFSQKPESTLAFEPLIQTSEASGTVQANMAGFMMPADFAREIKTDNKQRVLAALITGKFKSAFEGPPGEATGAHVAVAQKDSSVIVIGDIDLFADQNSVERMQFGGQTLLRVLNDNLNFLLNATDFLGGSQDLISIRSRGRVARPFKKVAELQKLAHEKWKDQEEKLTAELQELQKKLGELQNQRTDGNRFVLNSEQQDEIVKFRNREAEVRKKRRLVRKNLREDIESLGNKLLAVNMLAVPLLVSGFGFSVFFRRNRRIKQRGAK